MREFTITYTIKAADYSDGYAKVVSEAAVAMMAAGYDVFKTANEEYSDIRFTAMEIE